MDIQTLSKQVESIDDEPPFDKWHPTHCGDIDIKIAKDGRWYHEGSPIGRIALVKLFARVLIIEHGEFFLKTPAEKMRIQVEEVPFVITNWHQSQNKGQNTIEVTTNLDHTVTISEQHPIELKITESNEPQIYIEIHRGLNAKVHRNVYYQWVEIAQETVLNNQHHLIIESAGMEFSLGCID